MLDTYYATEQYNAENTLSDAEYMYATAQDAGVDPVLLTQFAETVHDVENACIEATHAYSDYCSEEGTVAYISQEGIA